MYAIDLRCERLHSTDIMNSEVFESLLAAAREQRRVGLRRPRRQANSAMPPLKPDGAEQVDVRRVRALTQLSQANFAELLGIELATLRNWEQGRRLPAGPARALLRAVRNDPINVIKALSDLESKVK